MLVWLFFERQILLCTSQFRLHYVPPNISSKSTVTPLSAITGTLTYSTAVRSPAAWTFKGEEEYASRVDDSRPRGRRKRGFERIRREFVIRRPHWGTHVVCTECESWKVMECFIRFVHFTAMFLAI